MKTHYEEKILKTYPKVSIGKSLNLSEDDTRHVKLVDKKIIIFTIGVITVIN